jgi:hypothetical protein
VIYGFDVLFNFGPIFSNEESKDEN